MSREIAGRRPRKKSGNRRPGKCRPKKWLRNNAVKIALHKTHTHSNKNRKIINNN